MLQVKFRQKNMLIFKPKIKIFMVYKQALNKATSSFGCWVSLLEIIRYWLGKFGTSSKVKENEAANLNIEKVPVSHISNLNKQNENTFALRDKPKRFSTVPSLK